MAPGWLGAIHGRLLTAWSAAGILGPVLVNYIREYQLAHGVPKAQVYSVTMYVLAGLLALGFVCNLLIRPVAEKNYMTAEQIAALDAASRTAAPGGGKPGDWVARVMTRTPTWQITVAWLAVGIPIAWGVWVTLQKAAILFGS